MIRATKEQFVCKAEAVHGKKYDYSKVVYVNNCTKVVIICPKHGEFEQKPDNHLNFPCSKCSREVADRKRQLGINGFISKARLVHGDRYDYGKVGYLGVGTPVSIICKQHGSFWQKPAHHLNSGSGCPTCAKIERAESKRVTFEEFVEKAREVHGDKYEYIAETHPDKMSQKMVMICKKHGRFKQCPSHHCRGVGCPKCGESKGERMVRQYLEKNQIIHHPQAAIGRKMRFDFVVQTKAGEMALIEFHGRQHYSPYSFSSDKSECHCKSNLLKQKERDALKRKWAENKSLRLLEIPYWDMGKINQILDEFLFCDQEKCST